MEKWRSWSDDLEAIDRDLLLTMLTIFWVTETIGTSVRDYYDMRWHSPDLKPGERVHVPTGVALFANELVSEGRPPREWAERLYDIQRWTETPRGGALRAGRAARKCWRATSPPSSMTCDHDPDPATTPTHPCFIDGR